MIGGEILRYHSGRIRSVRNCHCRTRRQGHDEIAHIIPLTGGGGNERIVNQNGETKGIALGPTGNLLSFLVHRQLHITICYRRRSRILLANRRNSNGGPSASYRRRRFRSQDSGQRNECARPRTTGPAVVYLHNSSLPFLYLL